MKWVYTEKPYSEILWEVLENGRRLFLVYRRIFVRAPGGAWYVWGGPFDGCEVFLDPFQLCIPDHDPNPLPVFVYQERPL